MRKTHRPDSIAAVFAGVDCLEVTRRWLLIKEDGSTLPVKPNHQVDYKLVEHGGLTLSTDNVACQGSEISIRGELHKSILSLLTVQVTISRVNIEIDGDQVKDLDQDIQLMSSCSRDAYCQVGEASYVVDNSKPRCSLHYVRIIPMKLTKVNTVDGMKKALVSHAHKTLLTLGPTEMPPDGCQFYGVVSTNYPCR